MCKMKPLDNQLISIFLTFKLFFWVICGKLYQTTQYFQGIQIKNSLNLILAFGFNKRFLNLNNHCVKSSQF